MPKSITNLVPEQWQDLVEFLAAPVSWIPGMQREILSFLINSASGWTAGVYWVLLLFPALLWIGAVWCTQLSLYTLPFRSGRLEFIKKMLLAWWDAGLAVWMFWVGLGRFFVVVVGWMFELARLGLKLIMETGRQVFTLPFKVTGDMTRSYFQPGVPWIAFLLLLFWCLLEAVIFSYVLFPTVSEVLAGLVGVEAHRLTSPFLFAFLFLLILGSYACLQALIDTAKNREYKFLVQMLLVELFVMFFEVMFLYRELVDAISPWIAQQTNEQFRMGIISTLSLAVFGWLGVRGMTWFLFGQFGTPPLLAFMSRRPLVPPEAEGRGVTQARAEIDRWWRAPLEDFKREIEWLHEKSNELMGHLTLPFLHVIAAALNFAMILVTSRPFFSIPFKNLKEVLETRETLAAMHLQPKKAAP
ncbi:MAG: hypothetical protein E6K57_03080 [Nitrospirae bacterium]|nr:MAG: hypothetical protein E6K57_03080 [Nitrospirota bacterium]